MDTDPRMLDLRMDSASPRQQSTSEDCDKTFATKRYLSKHRKAHYGEKQYKCAACDSRFLHSRYLEVHTRIHTGAKPFKCETCGKQFRQSSHLSAHIRTHTGEKPFKCDHCPRSFNQSAHRIGHMRLHRDQPSKELQWPAASRDDGVPDIQREVIDEMQILEEWAAFLDFGSPVSDAQRN